MQQTSWPQLFSMHMVVISACQASTGTASKVKVVVSKLSELAGLNNKESSQSQSTSIEAEPAFKRMRWYLCKLTSKVETPGSELQNIKATIESSSTDTKDANRLSSDHHDGIPPRPSPNPEQPSPSRLSPREPPSTEGVVGAFFGAHGNSNIHNAAMQVLGISTTKREVAAINTLLAEECPLAFSHWWRRVSPLKGHTQR